MERRPEQPHRRFSIQAEYRPAQDAITFRGSQAVITAEDLKHLPDEDREFIADLEDSLERLESDIARYRDLETLLRKTLVSAERSAQDLKDQARREADVLLSEAHAEARLIKQRAFAEREQLRGEASRIRSLLRSALAMVDPQQDGDEAAEAA